MHFKNQSLREYLEQLASRQPAPGGGSASALVGALGVALLSMVAQYSRGKCKTKKADRKISEILKKSERIRRLLLELVDKDAEAYLNVVKTRRSDLKTRRKALQKAREIPMKICRLCFEALDLSPDLVRYGNYHLLSDVKVAVDFLQAAFQGAIYNVQANQ